MSEALASSASHDQSNEDVSKNPVCPFEMHMRQSKCGHRLQNNPDGNLKGGNDYAIPKIILNTSFPCLAKICPSNRLRKRKGPIDGEVACILQGCKNEREDRSEPQQCDNNQGDIKYRDLCRSAWLVLENRAPAFCTLVRPQQVTRALAKNASKMRQRCAWS
jgi:hypothetical protein